MDEGGSGEGEGGRKGRNLGRAGSRDAARSVWAPRRRAAPAARPSPAPPGPGPRRARHKPSTWHLGFVAPARCHGTAQQKARATRDGRKTHKKAKTKANFEQKRTSRPTNKSNIQQRKGSPHKNTKKTQKSAESSDEKLGKQKKSCRAWLPPVGGSFGFGRGVCSAGFCSRLAPSAADAGVSPCRAAEARAARRRPRAPRPDRKPPARARARPHPMESTPKKPYCTVVRAFLPFRQCVPSRCSDARAI